MTQRQVILPRRPLYAFALSVTLSEDRADIKRLTDRMRAAQRQIALDRIERGKLLRRAVVTGASKNSLARLIEMSSGQFYKELEWPEELSTGEPPKRTGARV